MSHVCKYASHTSLAPDIVGSVTGNCPMGIIGSGATEMVAKPSHALRLAGPQLPCTYLEGDGVELLEGQVDSKR
jgi:hypothetical protein